MTSSVDLAIRLRRAAFNRALAERDLPVIGPLLAQNAMLVTGTDSAILVGRKAQLLAWKQEFTASQATLYVRTPDRVEASSVEPIAMEYGQWSGTNVANGTGVASGSYVAKWRLQGGNWVIEAEIYLTLS